MRSGAIFTHFGCEQDHQQMLGNPSIVEQIIYSINQRFIGCSLAALPH